MVVLENSPVTPPQPPKPPRPPRPPQVNPPRQYESWEVSDAFWAVAEPLIPKPERSADKTYQRKPGAGRKPMPPRKVMEAIFFVLRTGIQWKALPKAMGSGSAVHAYFQKWEAAGFFTALWEKGLHHYDELVGIEWEWQAIDGCKVESPLGQDAIGPNPVDRGKKWVRPAYALRRAGRAALTGGGRS